MKTCLCLIAYEVNAEASPRHTVASVGILLGQQVQGFLVQLQGAATGRRRVPSMNQNSERAG